MQSWQEHAGAFARVLAGLRVTDDAGRAVDADQAFLHWRDVTADLRRRRGVVYLVGNGASASMASHFATDLSKGGGLHAQVFTDPALVTAIGNDIGYEQVFAEPLRGRGRAGDMLVAISSSGRSPNVLAAAEAARALDMTIVTLSAKEPDNPLREAGRLNFYLPGHTYGLAETAHAAVLHWWMDLVQLEHRGSIA